MSNDVTKKPEPTAIDNFVGWTDGVQGDTQPEGGGVIQGRKLKFTNQGKWVSDDVELPADFTPVVVDVGRFVQKWGRDGGAPLETITIMPHEKFPDVERMNAECDRSEWVDGPGDGQPPRGPWQALHCAYLLDLPTMNRFSWPTSTIGGRICIRELIDKILWFRKCKDKDAYAMVKLTSVHMNTRFGGRMRPHCQIIRWVRLDGGNQGEALSSPAAQLDQPKPVQQNSPQSESPPWVNEVQEPTLQEEMNDEIADFGAKASQQQSPASQPITATPPKSNMQTTARRDLKPNAPQAGAKKPGQKPNLLDAG